MLWNCFCVGAGGFLGAVCRYVLGFLPVSDKTQFPAVTLGINVLGAFAIGLISQAAVKYIFYLCIGKFRPGGFWKIWNVRGLYGA